MTSDWQNKLHFGDNLPILRDNIPNESVDLIYLDPPFNSNATYNVLFREHDSSESVAQIQAFDDTWHWSIDSERAYREVVQDGPKKLADLLQAMRAFLGQNDMMAYLTMMAPRMVELHRVLKATGSIYLHCDPTASHYLKLLMDAVFRQHEFPQRDYVETILPTAMRTNSAGVETCNSLLFQSRVGSNLWNVAQEFRPQNTIVKDSLPGGGPTAGTINYRISDGPGWSGGELSV